MQSTAEAICVDPKVVREFWPHVRSFIKSACDRTGLTPFYSIEDDVLSGDELLWLAWNGEKVEAAATTRLVATGAKPVCELTACGGDDMRRWLPLLEKIEKFAKDEGCSCVRIYGRKGWLRVLQSYQLKHVILERPL